MLWDMYYMYILFFPACVFIFSYFYCFLKNKKLNNNILNVLWGLNIQIYYYMLFLTILFVVALTSRASFLSNSLTLYFFACCFIYLFFVCITYLASKNIVHCLPIMTFSVCTIFPIYIDIGFLGYVLMAEFGSSFLFIVFLTNTNSKDSNKKNNSFLSMIVYNFTTLVFFFVSLILLLVAYGTTNLNYLNILNNGTVSENCIFMICSFSLLIKIGFFPLFFYKRNIYAGLSITNLIAYTFVYNAFFMAPTLFYLINFICIMGSTYKIVIITFMLISTIPNLFSLKNLSDFVPLSTLIFSIFSILLCI